MAPAEEQALLDRLKADDRTALRDLFKAHYPMVCQAIYRLLQDRSTTEDLAQEVFLRFWEKRHKIEVSTSLPAYLRRMAVNEGLGYLRKTKRWSDNELEAEQGPAANDSAEAQYLQGELEQHITAAIHSLPPKCRTVFQLSRFEELTYQEIAEQMGISIKTVENQMGKALRVLRKRLQHYLQLLLWWLLPFTLLGMLPWPPIV
ncbi:MAG: RNA polymerase sigma-70 factor [Bacteroidetes bacterium]|jgi:RNA polymerase sigma-70 factor (ECF subfamily)|nr:RNA polymerase sigma-70 factor [Bacteroidota bacterium]